MGNGNLIPESSRNAGDVGRPSIAEKSTAWSEGHRFWCSAKDVEEDVSSVGVHGNPAGAAVGAGTVGVVGHAGDHMQVQVQQQDQGDHEDLPGIHIAAENRGRKRSHCGCDWRSNSYFNCDKARTKTTWDGTRSR